MLSLPESASSLCIDSGDAGLCPNKLELPGALPEIEEAGPCDPRAEETREFAASKSSAEGPRFRLGGWGFGDRGGSTGDMTANMPDVLWKVESNNSVLQPNVTAFCSISLLVIDLGQYPDFCVR